MSAEHPRVLAAKEAEEEIGRHLHDELALARRGVEVELRLIADRRALLEDQLAKTNERLRGLAAVRADYANQVAETKNRAVLLERAEQNLAEARAARASAKAASLISRIDAPDAGIRPVGPGRIVIALCGVLGGLLAGFGVVFLTVPAVTNRCCRRRFQRSLRSTAVAVGRNCPPANGHLRSIGPQKLAN